MSDVSDDGTTLTISDNAWKVAFRDTTITEDTVISFDFETDEAAEIYGIAFETDDLVSENLSFQLAGWQTWGDQSFVDVYEIGDGLQRLELDVGKHLTGDFDRIVFFADDDAAGGGEASFSNMVIDSMGIDDFLSF